ncbi:neurogenic locus notch homolog protein 1-like [Lytechinus variegatus]|uniref:neurogenic locus notch homolog protein 1-like n=1 Tax=Lytechinus variegatus TaxID=7654 RepID=UPI001BB2C6B8|nr:neurogenic locus notch homolog protein 1-like [Lytechinus variegatus]
MPRGELPEDVTVGVNSYNDHVIQCKSINTASGETIQLVIKWASRQMMIRNHDDVDHFKCPTSPKICTLPDCLSSPCQNGCTCMETDVSYKCICPGDGSNDHFEGLCPELNRTYLLDLKGLNSNLSEPVQCQNGKHFPHYIVVNWREVCVNPS